MKLAALLVVLLACEGQYKPKPRTRDQLLAQLAAAGSDHHVRPPTDQELAWITDRSTGEPQVRAKQALALLRQENAVAASRIGHEDEVVAWYGAELATCAALADVAVDEIVPLAGSDAAAAQAGRDVVSMVRGLAVSMVNGPTQDASRVVNETFHAHAASFRKVLTQDDCTRLAVTAPGLAGDLHDCLGGSP